MEIVLDHSRLPTITPKYAEDFTRNAEQRNFCADLASRIERISFGFDRLCELTSEHFKFTDAIDAKRGGNRTYTYTAEEVEAMARWHTEADVLTFYIYYELKSVCDMIRQWHLAPRAGSELEFALKARDRFLAHPEVSKVVPNQFRGKAIPYRTGMTRCYIAGLQQWDAISRDCYLRSLGMPTGVSQPGAEKEAVGNEGVIRRSTRNRDLKHDEVTRLKAFGVREPDLEKALREFASEVLPHVLKRIVDIHEEAVSRFGFERGTAGPLMLAKLF